MNSNETDALGYYAALNLHCDADDAAIKQNYRDLAKHWHPDHNTSAEALDNFKKISVAYDVLKDEDKRLVYDLLSTVYAKDKYPDPDMIKPLRTASGGADVQALAIENVRGELIRYKTATDRCVCSYREALRLEFKSSVLNWLLGWWHPRAFFKNIRALVNNFNNVNSRAENAHLFIHNAVAYRHDGKEDMALQSAAMALPYASPRQSCLLKRFIGGASVAMPKRPAWNYLNLQLVQLVMPLALVLLALMPLSVKVVSESDLLNYFAEKKEIDYNQQVEFRTGGSMSDDMVVGKVVNIPVDLSDSSKLYHLTSEQNLMYGPADDFDVMRRLKSGKTVRITGYTPDNIWFRVMLDEGEMGFVRQEYLRQGVGAEIPYGSKIVKR